VIHRISFRSSPWIALATRGLAAPTGRKASNPVTGSPLRRSLGGFSRCARPKRKRRRIEYRPKDTSCLRLAIIAAAVCLLFGCNDSPGPTAPVHRLSPSPTPLASTTESWDLTDEVTGNSGESFCIVTPGVGVSLHTTFELLRSGNSISFVMPDQVDWESYTGTVNGSTFSATSPSAGSGMGMCTHYLQTSSLSGSFSEDGRTLTATEVWLFLFDTGQRTITFHWSARRL
jgi:hypothetical protein